MSRSIPTRAKKNAQEQAAHNQTAPCPDNAGFLVHQNGEVKPLCFQNGFEEDRGWNDAIIETSMSDLHQLIIDVVGRFSKVVVVDEFSWPQVSDTHIWFGELYALFSSGLGLQDDETLDVAFRRLNVDFRDIRIYLRMLIAIAIHDWVFISSFPEVPILSRDWAQQAFRPFAADCGQDYVDRVARLALLAISDDKLLKETREKRMEHLASDLLQALNPLLTSYKSFAVDREASKAREKLLKKHCDGLMTDIFKTAMTIRVEMNLKEYDYAFFWPGAGTPFDGATMNAEVFHRRTMALKDDAQGGKNVAATLLPGIYRVSPDESQDFESGKPTGSKSSSRLPERQGKLILPALVYLQERGVQD